MPILVNVTLQNSGQSQHVYHATDDVLDTQVLAATPLGPGESVAISLAADEDGHGRMTYGISGGVDVSRLDLNDGDTLNDV